MKSSTIVIHPSYKKVFKHLLVVTFIFGCSLLVIMRPSSIVGTICAWMALPFFGFLTVHYLVRLIRRKPVVVIDENGIDVNVSWVSIGFIPWSDIRRIGITSYSNLPILGILLYDSKKYAAKVGFIKRYFMRRHIVTIGYPVFIAQSILPISLEQLIEHINRHFKSH